MRGSWIILVLAGVVPTCAFYVLDWTGGTESLRYISTTAWQWGDPSLTQLALMFLSLFTWMWVKGVMNVFFVAALPFFIADVARRARLRRTRFAEAQERAEVS